MFRSFQNTGTRSAMSMTTSCRRRESLNTWKPTDWFYAARQEIIQQSSDTLSNHPVVLHNENSCRIFDQNRTVMFLVRNRESHIAFWFVSYVVLKGEKITAAARLVHKDRGTAFFLSALSPLFAISKAVRDVRVIADYARASIMPGNSSSAGLRRSLPHVQASGLRDT